MVPIQKFGWLRTNLKFSAITWILTVRGKVKTEGYNIKNIKSATGKMIEISFTTLNTVEPKLGFGRDLTLREMVELPILF